MLDRREIENYLFDKEVLKVFCLQNGTSFDEVKYDGIVTDIMSQDLKSNHQNIQLCCEFSGNLSEFKRNLAKIIPKINTIYNALERVIFEIEIES